MPVVLVQTGRVHTPCNTVSSPFQRLGYSTSDYTRFRTRVLLLALSRSCTEQVHQQYPTSGFRQHMHCSPVFPLNALTAYIQTTTSGGLNTSTRSSSAPFAPRRLRSYCRSVENLSTNPSYTFFSLQPISSVPNYCRVVV